MTEHTVARAIAAHRTTLKSLEGRLDAPGALGERDKLKDEIISLFRIIEQEISDLTTLKDDVKKLVEKWKALQAGQSLAPQFSVEKPVLHADHIGASTFIEKGWSRLSLGDYPAAESALALTAEYSVKAAYGWVIGVATGSAYAAEDLKIYARVNGATEDMFRDARVEKVRAIGQGGYVIRLPRYEAFTGTALSLIDARVRFVDVAGNHDILITVIAPMALDDRVFGTDHVIAAGPLLTDPQRKRVAVRVSVERLHEIVPAVRAAGGTIEHLYDY